MQEEKICPVCGSRMRKLSPQSWACKCGHIEKGEIKKGKKNAEEMEREEKEELRVRFWEQKRGEKSTKYTKREIVDRKKRV